MLAGQADMPANQPNGRPASSRHDVKEKLVTPDVVFDRVVAHRYLAKCRDLG